MTRARLDSKVSKPIPTTLEDKFFLKKRFVLAPLTAAIAAVLSASPALSQEKSKTIEEITVTATKRQLDLQDVAQSISAFSTADIQKMGIKSMSDYVNALPSVNLTATQPGRNSLTMRGISSGSGEYYTDGQVAVYLDEQPMTTNSQQVSVRTIDMERVESLQGPQGTLFGSSSQTGTLRLITNKPNQDGFSGHIEAGYGTTKGGDASYDISGHLNIPLSDALAMRVVAYTSNDGGFVDNVYGQTLSGNFDNADIVDSNQNEYGTVGGRVAFLWNINEDWSGLLSVIGESTDLDGAWETDPSLGDHKITRFEEEERDDEWLSAAFTLNGDLGFAEVSATVTHYERDITYLWDNNVYTQYKDSAYQNSLYDTEYQRSDIFNDQTQERSTFELRLASSGESRLQWIAGVYYEEVHDEWFYGTHNENLVDSDAWYYANYYAYNYQYNGSTTTQYPLPATDLGYVNIFDRTVEQTALFGEVTYDLNDQVRLLVGARWAEFDRLESDLTSYPAGLVLEDAGASISEGKDSDSIYKASLQYAIDDDLMIYGLYSQGFRLGGKNAPRPVATGTVLAEYGSDTLDNYELGIKSQWLDNRLQINAQIFHMQWSDYQQSFTGSKWWERGTVNAGDAKTTGVEFNVAFQATDNLRINLNMFAADAKFDSDAAFDLNAPDALYIRKGMDMPGSPDLKGWMSVNYDIPNVFGGDAWVYFDTSYQGETWNSTDDILADNRNGLSDTYTVSNLSLGLDLPDDLRLTLRVDNLFDSNDTTYISTSFNDNAAFFGDSRFRNEQSRERPRTVWFGVRKDF